MCSSTDFSLHASAQPHIAKLDRMTAQAAAEASALRSENHLTKATLSSASRDSGILSSTLAHLPATDSVQNFPKWGLSFGLSHYAGFFQVTGVVEGSFASSICGVVREAWCKHVFEMRPCFVLF